MKLLEKICEELGVEVGEEWLGIDGDKYTISEDGGLTRRDQSGYCFNADNWLPKLLTGELKPVWKPKEGETYYMPRITLDPKHRYWGDIWRNRKWDNWAYDNKLIFETKEEAINHTNEMIELAKHGI